MTAQELRQLIIEKKKINIDTLFDNWIEFHKKVQSHFKPDFLKKYDHEHFKNGIDDYKNTMIAYSKYTDFVHKKFDETFNINLSSALCLFEIEILIIDFFERHKKSIAQCGDENFYNKVCQLIFEMKDRCNLLSDVYSNANTYKNLI